MMSISTLGVLCCIATGAVWYYTPDDKRIKSLVAKKYIAKAKQNEWLVVTPLGREFLRTVRKVKV